MLKKLFSKPVLIISIIVLLILISIPFQNNIDSQRDKFRSIQETVLLTSSALKKVSLGFNELLSDIYWFRALQYVGSDDIPFSEKDPELLYKYLDLITDLDPKFINAYRFGGTFLAEPDPYGLANIEYGGKLLDKGRENNPDNFRLPLEEAFLYYLYTDNYNKAATLFEEASRKPGLSELRSGSFRGMAATARQRGGDRELSKKIWIDIYDNTTDEGRRDFALRNLNELNTMDFEDKLSELVQQFDSDNGRLPYNLDELVNTGYLKKVPKDHGDEDFVIVRANKTVKSPTLASTFFNENLGFINSRSRRFNSEFGRYPANINELRLYMNETAGVRGFPEHPLGEEYIYDPETGVVDYDNWFLE